MRTENLVLMIISLTTIVISLVVSLVNLKREIDIHRRSKISFHNYLKMENYFNFAVKPLVLIINGLFYAIAITTCFLLVYNVQLWYYLIAIVVSIITVSITLYLYVSSVKYNIDLSAFNNYYDTIKSNYSDKKLISENIKKIKEKKDFITKQIDSLEKECYALFVNHNKITNVESCLNQINEVESEQYKIYKSFDEKTSNLFTKSLREFLKTRGKVDSSIFIVNNSFIIDIELLTTNALQQLKELFKYYVVTTYINNKNNTIKDVENVTSCLKKLDDFNEYFNLLQEYYDIRNNINDNINNLYLLRKDIIEEAKKYVQEFRRLFPKYSKTISFDQSLKEIDVYIANNTGLINKYDENILELSTLVLNDYLENKPANKQNYSQFSYVDKIDLDALKNNAMEIMSTTLNSFVKEEYYKGGFHNSEELLNICEYMYKHNGFDNECLFKLINYIASSNNRFESCIDFVFEKSLISYDLLIYCNEHGYDWIYSRSVNSFLNYNQLTQLIVNIIDHNLIKVTNRYLLLCDKNDINYIKNALSVTKEKNETRTLIENYISLLQLDGGFNMLSTRYENLALVLRYYYNHVSGSSNEAIERIIDQEEFYENKDYLDKIYNNELLKMGPLMLKTFKSLLYYSLYCAKTFDSLIDKKIKELYVDYKKTLYVNGLLCLSSLLDALMLINLKDKTQIIDIMENINTNSNLINYDSYYPLTANKSNNYKMYGKDIIDNLITNHFPEVSAIINYSEKERLFIDKIR